jgi:hypothetical protein
MKSLSRLIVEFATAQKKYKRRSMGDRIGETIVGKTGVGMAARGLALAGAIRYGRVAGAEIGGALRAASKQGLTGMKKVKTAFGVAKTEVPKALGEAFRNDKLRVRIGTTQLGNVARSAGNLIVKPKTPFQMKSIRTSQNNLNRNMMNQTARRMENEISGKSVYKKSYRDPRYTQ